MTDSTVCTSFWVYPSSYDDSPKFQKFLKYIGANVVNDLRHYPCDCGSMYCDHYGSIDDRSFDVIDISIYGDFSQKEITHMLSLFGIGRRSRSGADIKWSKAIDVMYRIIKSNI